MTITQEVANWMEQEAYGTIGEDIFVENLPAKVDYAVVVSLGVAGSQNTYLPMITHVVDLYVRDTTSTSAEGVVMDIFNKLHRKNEYTFTAGGQKIMQSEARLPQFIGKDESSRFMYRSQLLLYTRNPDNEGV